ncbi:MAG: heavy metal-associated domain-containing protein [Bacteroidota bacterium]|nr:heavy metal-associated domain-containing protein [Bacteroidota bacterium]MEE3036874.1 heavy metal-associated domain-containing protein [Bacteroidota bacterium]
MIKNRLTIVFVSALLACTTSEKVDTKSEPIAVADATAQFTIEGMSCQVGCAAYIDEELEKMSGVVSSEVNYESQMAVVKYDNSLVSEYAMMNLINTVKDSAYQVTSVEVEIIKSADKNKIDTH